MISQVNEIILPSFPYFELLMKIRLDHIPVNWLVGLIRILYMTLFWYFLKVVSTVVMCCSSL